ncbi:MAG: DUF721 domain-containing protein [Elusimicrobiaceae bacterium]|nr:DUF721 domain-containing protein [Elusimicrobiaceae bacterium]
MKFGQNPKKQWRSTQELVNGYSPLSQRLNRLVILEHVWKKLVGNKAAFWVLHAVQGDTLFVNTKAAVAKNELIARKTQLIKELNKNFTTPWIKKIEIK